MTDMKMWT